MRIALFIGIICGFFSLHAQDLDEYIKIALENNLALQQQELSYQEALAQMDQAKALFWPKLSIEGRYSVAAGGRAFTIPAGDLVNPAYQNLNFLNQYASGIDPDYPTFPVYDEVPNQEVNFLRATEQETSVRVSMPVYNNSLILNQRIKENMAAAADAGRSIYRQELVKEVRSAYFRYAQATYGLRIYENALELVQENLRTTESLERNHKVTAAAIFGAQAEVAKVQQELATAREQEQTALAYFNFLLNRSFTAEVSLPEEMQTTEFNVLSLEAARNQGLQERIELQQLNYYLSAAEQNVSIARGNRLPMVNLRADYGIQGTAYTFDQDADFFMGSVVFSIPLFDRTTSPKVQESKLAFEKLAQQKAEVQQQIGLQIVQQYYGLQAAFERIEAARAQRNAAYEFFRLVKRQYEQGQANLVTFTEARTQFTNAEESLVIAQFDYLIQQAAFQRAIGEQ